MLRSKKVISLVGLLGFCCSNVGSAYSAGETSKTLEELEKDRGVSSPIILSVNDEQNKNTGVGLAEEFFSRVEFLSPEEKVLFTIGGLSAFLGLFLSLVLLASNLKSYFRQTFFDKLRMKDDLIGSMKYANSWYLSGSGRKYFIDSYGHHWLYDKKFEELKGRKEESKKYAMHAYVDSKGKIYVIRGDGEHLLSSDFFRERRLERKQYAGMSFVGRDGLCFYIDGDGRVVKQGVYCINLRNVKDGSEYSIPGNKRSEFRDKCLKYHSSLTQEIFRNEELLKGAASYEVCSELNKKIFELKNKLGIVNYNLRVLDSCDLPTYEELKLKFNNNNIRHNLYESNNIDLPTYEDLKFNSNNIVAVQNNVAVQNFGVN